MPSGPIDVPKKNQTAEDAASSLKSMDHKSSSTAGDLKKIAAEPLINHLFVFPPDWLKTSNLTMMETLLNVIVDKQGNKCEELSDDSANVICDDVEFPDVMEAAKLLQLQARRKFKDNFSPSIYKPLILIDNYDRPVLEAHLQGVPDVQIQSLKRFLIEEISKLNGGPQRVSNLKDLMQLIRNKNVEMNIHPILTDEHIYSLYRFAKSGISMSTKMRDIFFSFLYQLGVVDAKLVDASADAKSQSLPVCIQIPNRNQDEYLISMAAFCYHDRFREGFLSGVEELALKICDLTDKCLLLMNPLDEAATPLGEKELQEGVKDDVENMRKAMQQYAGKFNYKKFKEFEGYDEDLVNNSPSDLEDHERTFHGLFDFGFNLPQIFNFVGSEVPIEDAVKPSASDACDSMATAVENCTLSKRCRNQKNLALYQAMWYGTDWTKLNELIKRNKIKHVLFLAFVFLVNPKTNALDGVLSNYYFWKVEREEEYIKKRDSLCNNYKDSRMKRANPVERPRGEITGYWTYATREKLEKARDLMKKQSKQRKKDAEEED
uniref:Uncharacterized protein n=1 Tax=Ditylenchus dipsaci TaxID=166011 RepID=A0A915DKE3_9BILA